MRHALALAALLLALHEAPAAKAADPVDASARLGAGDRVTIQVYGHPDLSGDFLIDSQGNITLPIGGQVAAAEATPAEVERRVTATLADGYILQPRVSVRTAELRPVYVLGDVRAGGAIPFRQGMTALVAIAMAGGPASTDPETAMFRGDLVESEERLGLLEAQGVSLRARIARLEAQRDGATAPVFPEDIRAGGPALLRVMAGEQAIFDSEREAEQRQLSLITQQVRNAEAEGASLAEQLRLERQQLQTMQSYTQELTTLARNGLVDRRRLVEAQRDVARTEANVARLGTEATRAAQIGREAPLRLAEVRGNTQQRALLGLQEARARLADVETGMAAAREQIALRRQRIGLAATVKAGAAPRLVVIRSEVGGAKTIDAEEATPLRPGDILRVSGGAGARVAGAAPSRPSPADPRRQ